MFQPSVKLLYSISPQLNKYKYVRVTVIKRYLLVLLSSDQNAFEMKTNARERLVLYSTILILRIYFKAFDRNSTI